MCDFQQLYTGPEGYVVRCGECGYLQCAFGSTVLTLEDEDFRALKQLAVTQWVAATDDYPDELKQYWLPTAHPGVSMLLTRPELRRLCHMLEKADTEMAVSALVGLFEES